MRWIMSWFQQISASVLRFITGVTRIELVDADYYLEVDGTGHMILKNGKPTMRLILDGRQEVWLNRNGINQVLIGSTGCHFMNNSLYRTGSQSIKYNTGETQTATDDHDHSEIVSDNGGKSTITLAMEELTIGVGLGAGGVDTTAFIPEGCAIDYILYIVTQAPGSDVDAFDACIKADGNQSIADNVASALNTKGNNIVDGDGNRTNPWGQGVAVEITVTTQNGGAPANVGTSDMKIRFEVYLKQITEPTS